MRFQLNMEILINSAKQKNYYSIKDQCDFDGQSAIKKKIHK